MNLTGDRGFFDEGGQGGEGSDEDIEIAVRNRGGMAHRVRLVTEVPAEEATAG